MNGSLIYSVMCMSLCWNATVYVVYLLRAHDLNRDLWPHTRALLYDSERVKTADGSERAETLSPPPSLFPSCSVSAITEKETRCWNTSLLRDDPLPPQHHTDTHGWLLPCLFENSHAFASDRQEDHSTCSPQLRRTSGGLSLTWSLGSQRTELWHSGGRTVKEITPL